MLRGVRSILGYKVKAKDGQCGFVHDFLFDDQPWQLSHLVVKILLPQKALRLLPLSPETPGTVLPEDQVFVIGVSSAAILSSPSIDTNPPVSRQRKRRLSALKIVIPFLPDEFAGVPVPAPFVPSPAYRKALSPATQVPAEEEAKWNPHLRSTREVIGYRLQAPDGRAGALEDFIFDDHDFSIRHLVVLTQRLLLRKRVIVTPTEVISIGWDLARVNVSIDRRTLRKRHPV